MYLSDYTWLAFHDLTLAAIQHLASPAHEAKQSVLGEASVRWLISFRLPSKTTTAGVHCERYIQLLCHYQVSEVSTITEPTSALNPIRCRPKIAAYPNCHWAHQRIQSERKVSVARHWAICELAGMTTTAHTT